MAAADDDTDACLGKTRLVYCSHKSSNLLFTVAVLIFHGITYIHVTYKKLMTTS